MYKKGGPLNLLTWLKGGYLKNVGAISGGLKKIWNKKQFLLHPSLQLKLWLVPKYVCVGGSTHEPPSGLWQSLVNNSSIAGKTMIWNISKFPLSWSVPQRTAHSAWNSSQQEQKSENQNASIKVLLIVQFEFEFEFIISHNIIQYIRCVTM